MGKENPHFPCLANPERDCNCPLLSANVKYINNLGGKDRAIRSAMQRDGYHPVSPGLIAELIRDPYGGYYTDIQEGVYPFSEEMRKIRQKILNTWNRRVSVITKELPEYTCPELLPPNRLHRP